MYHLPNDTIAGIKAGPLFCKRSRASVLVPRVAAQTKKYLKEEGTAHVEREGLGFYLLNHIFWAISRKRAALELLNPGELELARGYDAMASKVAKRLFYYTLLITSRESRHMHKPSAKSTEAHAEARDLFGPEFVTFHKMLMSGGDVVAKFTNDPPMMPLGPYVAGLAHVFYKGAFSHGYGGKPWGDIAETLRKLVYGETTFEMFADTAFTLCHNGGPMFNKGMLYHMYDGAMLYKILDVQRSGQIPELVLEKGVSHVTPELYSVLSEFLKEYPTEVSPFIDWFKVEAAGSVHKYGKEKQAQVSKHGQSKTATEEMKKLASRFYIMPDVYVTKYDRKVA